MLFIILKSRIIGEEAGVVVDGKDVVLLTGYYLINYSVISKKQFPDVFVI